MPRIQVNPSCIVEDDYFIPSTVLENLYAEEADPLYGWNWRLIPTPGLSTFSDTTGVSGRGLFQSDAIASGSIIQVFGGGVYKVDSNGAATALTGTVINTASPVEPVAFASSQTELAVLSEGRVYEITSTAVTQYTSALTGAGASGDLLDIAVANNRHLIAEDNSGRVWYSDPGDCQTIGGFFTAERDPDQVKALLVVGSNVLVFGSRKTEFWTPTSSTTEPFIQRQGYVLEVGIVGSRARGQIGGSAYWVGHDNTVRRWSGVGAEKISGHWLERKIASLTSANKSMVRITCHSWLGHDFVKVYLPGKGSFFFDATTGAWHRRRDLGDALTTDWSFDYFVEAFGNTYVQYLTNGVIYKLDNTVFKENSVAVRRVATALVSLKDPIQITNISVEGAAGVGLNASGVDEDDNPEIMLRASYDGHTFGDELTATIGAHAAYKHKAIFGSMGTFYPPIVKIEVAYSAAVGYTIYGLTYNEQVR